MGINSALSTFNAALKAERPRFILWAPVWLMLGIAAYFSLLYEPSPLVGIVGLAVTGLLLGLSWRRPSRWLVLPIFLVALGFAAGELRIHLAGTPLLTHALYYRDVDATIDEVDLIDKDTKLVLSQLKVADLPPQETPLRVRVRFHHQDNNWQVGDRVHFKAALFPLPQPAMPDSFDFAQYFYFRGVGGNGFAMGPLEITETSDPTTFSARLSRLRHTIGNDMREHMPGAVGTVAAAMTVGETGPIPEDVKDTLRDSGLAHMLAIAGLHLGIVAGIVFFNVRLVLTLYPKLALRLPVKKIAALCGLAVAFVYLSLAGYPVPAERAFIMVSFLFMAMVIDRRGITLRTLAIAAMLILLIFPEAMLGPSFQLSFAATLAIISLFERFGEHLNPHGGNWRQWAWRHMIGIICTSLVATLATAPFVLYHFNRFAIFGLLANMVVVPLATFVIMPGMLLSLLLMPFGLQAIGYVPLQFGTNVMIAMASHVTSLPYASLHAPSLTAPGMVLCAFGLLWLCLQEKRRWLGVPAIALGLMTIALYQPYDLMVSDDGTKVAIRQDDDHVLFVRGRPSSFSGKTWLRASGDDEGQTLTSARGQDNLPDCDSAQCDVTLKGKHIIVARHGGDTSGLCKPDAFMVISGDALSCQGVPWLVDKKFLQKNGMVAFRFGDKGVQMESVAEYRARRPWVPTGVPPAETPLYQSNNSSISVNQ